MTREAAGFHDRNAGAFLDQYGADPDFSERRSVWNALFDRHAATPARALDLGCGGGFLSFALSDRGLTVLGVDGSEEMIHRCKTERAHRNDARATFARMDLPSAIPGAPFDLVVASSLVEYLPDDADTDRWLAGLVAPGGTLILSLPNRESCYRKWETLRYRLTGRPAYRAHVKRLASPGDTADRLAAHGLRLVQVRYYARRPLLSRLAAALFPSRRSDNLFAAVFRRIRP